MADDPDPWTREGASRLFHELRTAWHWVLIVFGAAVLFMYGLDRVMHLIIP
jgi:hypothetical protein